MATSAGSGSGDNRLKSYKTKGFTLEESRKKREEDGIQLRKSKRDEQVRRHNVVFLIAFYTFLCVLLQLSKRRNLDAVPDIVEASGAASFSFPEVRGRYRGDVWCRYGSPCCLF